MLKVREIVVVEGKYDQIRLSSVIDGTVVATNGFRILGDKAQLQRLRTMAKGRGVLLLTDSDGAGLIIRRYLQGALPGIPVRHAYIPSIPGKERRKSTPSKEGLLGVEGMDDETLRRVLCAVGITEEGADTAPPSMRLSAGVTKARLFADGLTGGECSAARRRRFLELYGLPSYLSTGRLLEWINTALTEEEYAAAVARVTNAAEDADQKR